MAKRFTDTEIWDEDWFIKLPVKYKLLWFFIKDKCDDSGVWRPNIEIFQRIVSEPVNLNEFLVYVNGEEKTRIFVLKNKNWFLGEYFFYQYGANFNINSPVHKGFLKRLVKNGIHIKDVPKINCGNLLNVDFKQLESIAYQ